MKNITSASLLSISLLALAVFGCGSTDSTSSDTITTNNGHEQATPDEEGGQTQMNKMKAELAKLSPEDAKSAEEQHTCPVSGEMLGTMGPPQKVEVAGQQVWICCDGCKDRLLQDPDEYFAKLGKR